MITNRNKTHPNDFLKTFIISLVVLTSYQMQSKMECVMGT